MKLYLDDERKTPIGWFRSYTVDETIEYLKKGNIEEVSLDHDLAEQHYYGDYSGEKTGYEVLVWIERAVVEEGFKPPIIRIHTMNGSAKLKMYRAMKKIYELAGFIPETNQCLHLNCRERISSITCEDCRKVL